MQTTYQSSIVFSGGKQTNTAIQFNNVTVINTNNFTTWLVSRNLQLGQNTFEIRARRNNLNSPIVTRTVFRHGTADVNGDGTVNVFDLGIFAANYGTTNIGSSASSTLRLSDMNNDGSVNVFDLGIFAGRYGTTFDY